MRHVEWSKRFSVGVPELDAQHVRIIELLNDMADAAACPEDGSRLRAVLAGLKAHAAAHFSAEEAVVRKVAPELLAFHQGEHLKFLSRVREFTLALDADAHPPMLPLEMFHFLKSWFEDHILGVDMQYAARLRHGFDGAGEPAPGADSGPPE
mgnify:FL=1